MRCPSDRRVDIAVERIFSDLFCPAPSLRVRMPAQRAVAGKCELAASWFGRTFVDDAADACGESGVTDPVENDLRDRSFAVLILVPGLVIDRACKTVQSLGSGLRIASEFEG